MQMHSATIRYYDSFIAFYDDVIEHTLDVEKYARWQKGKHPTADSIKAYIEEGSMYLYKEQDAIVGAMAVTMYQGADYHAIEWGKQHLYAENTGWTDFYFYEYEKRDY